MENEVKKPSRARLLWLIPLVLGTIYILQRNQREQTIPFTNVQGLVFGTYYSITYQYGEDLKTEIDEELKRFDNSLSPFNQSSIISRVNRNEDVEVDTLFENVFNRSGIISEETNGAFDATIAPLANAWGFGFKKGDFPTDATVDSLLQITDYRKVSLQNNKVIKEDPRIMISYSAIAKGYSVDVIAGYLDRKGIKNYMVDIGGEIVVKGINPQGEAWRIGISQPSDDKESVNQDVQLIFQITDVGVATSGNYRNFYYKDGKKYAHTIDPRTGYPVQHSILSATVLADDCMSADAYATAFMVMGLDESIEFLNSHPEIGACFIYSGEDGEYQTYLTENIKKYVVESN